MVAEGLLFCTNSLRGMSIHMFGCYGITMLFCSQQSISSSISTIWSTSFSRTKGSRVLRKPFLLRPISVSVSQKISLSRPGRTSTMEDEDTEVADVQRKIPLPEVFLTFLKQNGVDPAVYDAARDLPRYIRLKHKLQSEFSEIEEELGVKLSPLSWLSGFYSIPPEVQITGTKAYQEGKIYGMDAASGAAVEALDVCPGDHVLDLCAAPGAKLCMMADLLNDSGTLTATDISPSRLAVSRTMLLKYGLGSRCRLFLADGTTFSLLPLKDSAQNSFITEVAAKADVKGLPKQTERHERHMGILRRTSSSNE